MTTPIEQPPHQELDVPYLVAGIEKLLPEDTPGQVMEWVRAIAGEYAYVVGEFNDRSRDIHDAASVVVEKLGRAQRRLFSDSPYPLDNAPDSDSRA